MSSTSTNTNTNTTPAAPAATGGNTNTPAQAPSTPVRDNVSCVRSFCCAADASAPLRPVPQRPPPPVAPKPTKVATESYKLGDVAKTLNFKGKDGSK